MRYLLDTNILVALMRPRRRESARNRLRELAPDEAVTSVVAAHELYLGAATSAKPIQGRRSVDLILREFEPLEFTRDDAVAAGEIRAKLRAAGMSIGPYDVLLAGQAKARGLVLVTNNMREFKRVEGLAVEDWLTA